MLYDYNVDMKIRGKLSRIGGLVICMFVIAGNYFSSAHAQVETFALTILHTNDTHGRIDQFTEVGSRCTPADEAEDRCVGGVARRATIIKQVRAEGGNVLLLDGGDQFQGTLFYTKYKGEEASTFMNLLGYDAMALVFLLYGGVSIVLGILDRDYSNTGQLLVFLGIGMALVTLMVGFRDRKMWGWYGQVGAHALVMILVLFHPTNPYNWLLFLLSGATVGLLFAPPTRTSFS